MLKKTAAIVTVLKAKANTKEVEIEQPKKASIPNFLTG